MSDAPEKIWAMQFDEPVDANSQGTWGTVNGLERKQRTEYTRTDIANARIAKLEAALGEIADTSKPNESFEWARCRALTALNPTTEETL
jgi:hypothetical protein